MYTFETNGSRTHDELIVYAMDHFEETKELSFSMDVGRFKKILCTLEDIGEIAEDMKNATQIFIVKREGKGYMRLGLFSNVWINADEDTNGEHINYLTYKINKEVLAWLEDTELKETVEHLEMEQTMKSFKEALKEL
ncbi:hypothetical protein DXT76_10795 [Halobacillus trueperi]|uniref:Uncharacterized protein n=1 Tax=Halobacillus trueperi TaxID=156205 RepID=A0A3D8VN77_9BACI|nr:hypothetical protein [Halobacillus trueperi]RDY70864.1 hypothetical protein DXT76_10795 [Halobacillus trueperi]